MLTCYKFLFCQSVFLLSISLNIIKQSSGEIIQVDLHSGESYTNLLNNSQIIVINYHLRNKATLASNYELAPIVYKSHLNLQSKSLEGIQRELSRILPLLIYTRDDWTGLTAQLPFFFMGNHVFTERGGTICPMNLQMDVVNKSIITETILPKIALTTIMTSSPYPINFTFKADVQKNTTLFLNSTLTKQILPFEPLILRFKFDKDTTTVKLIVTSNDTRCMIIAAEFTRCPTFTTFDSKIEFGPLTQRMQEQGVLILEKSNYRGGELFIVLETQPSEDICKDDATYNASDPRGVGKLKDPIYHIPDEDANLTKTVNISLQSVSITQFDWLINKVIGIYLPLIVSLILGIKFFSFPFYIFCIKCYIRISNLKIREKPLTIYSIVRNFCILLYLCIDNRLCAHSLNEPPVTPVQTSVTCSEATFTESEGTSIMKYDHKKSYRSMDPKSSDNAPASQSQQQKQLPKHMVTQSKEQNSQPKTNKSRYDHESSYLLTFNNSINIFWALAIQTSWYLLSVYQFVALSRGWIHALGDSHYCYYDYKCAKPFAFESFNIHVPSLHNILSNGPYICLGLFFMILVYIRKFYRTQNTPLLISLGASLMMEGIFSAIYHICPSTYKFQFDTTFMYTMLFLHISVLLYSNSPVSPTQNDNSFSKHEGASQVSRRRQFSQWPIFAALIMLSWLVVLNENLEKAVSAIIFFCITLLASLYLLVKLIRIITDCVKKSRAHPLSEVMEAANSYTNAANSDSETVATSETVLVYKATQIPGPGDCAPDDSTSQFCLNIVILSSLIFIVLLVLYLSFTGFGILGALAIWYSGTGALVSVIIIHLAAIISFSFYLYEANIEIEWRYGVRVNCQWLSKALTSMWIFRYLECLRCNVCIYGKRFVPKIRHPAKLAIIGILFLINISYIIVSIFFPILKSLPNYFLFVLGINWGILYFYFIIRKTYVVCMYYKSTTSIVCCFHLFLQKLQKYNCNRYRWWIVQVVYYFRCFNVVVVIVVSFVLFGCAACFFVSKTYNTEKSPMESLTINAGCVTIFPIENVYDAHDWWHVFSAFSLFLVNVSMLFFNEDLDSIEQANRDLEEMSKELDELSRELREPNKNDRFVETTLLFLKLFKNIPVFLKRDLLVNLGKFGDSDRDANQILQRCDDEFKNWNPIKIKADGNCLLNVFATFLLEKHDAEMSKSLRVYSTFELINNIDVYKQDELCRRYLRHSDGTQADDHEIEKEIIKEAKCCAQLREPCGFITLIAIANILRRPIRLVHPRPSDNIRLVHDHHVMNQTINPTVTEPLAKAIHVLACGNAELLESGEEWRPNHFVLLIDPNSPVEYV